MINEKERAAVVERPPFNTQARDARMTSRKHSPIAPSVQPDTPTAGGLESRFAMIPAHAIDDPELTLVDLRVLGVIAYHSGRQRAAWPKQQTIADRLQISRETVNRAVKRLVDKSLIEVRHQFRTDGGKRTNLYVVKYDVPIDALPVGGEDEDDTLGAPPHVTPGSHTHVTPAITSHVTPAITSTKDEQTTKNIPPNPLRGDELVKTFEDLWDIWPDRGRSHSAGRDRVIAQLEKISTPLPQIVEAARAFVRGSNPKFCPGLQRWLRDGKFEAWLPKAATSKPGQGASVQGVGLPCPVSEQGEKMLAELVAAYGSTKIAAWFSAVSWETDLIRAANAYDAQRIVVEFGGFLRKFGFTVVEGSAAA